MGDRLGDVEREELLREQNLLMQVVTAAAVSSARLPLTQIDTALGVIS